MPWNWREISRNHMEAGKEKWIAEFRLKIIKALQNQRHWRMASNNPTYHLAQKLIKERLDN